MTYSDNRVPVQPGYDTVNSARFVAALFSRGREAEESEKERERERDPKEERRKREDGEKESAREEERERSVGGRRCGRGRNSLCYRLKFFTGKILIVAFY